MARLSIHLLGPFQVTLDGQLVTGFVSDKARALLRKLAIAWLANSCSPSHRAFLGVNGKKTRNGSTVSDNGNDWLPLLAGAAMRGLIGASSRPLLHQSSTPYAPRPRLIATMMSTAGDSLSICRSPSSDFHIACCQVRRLVLLWSAF
jgi:hypothetical protein